MKVKKLILKLVVLFLLIIACSYKYSPEWFFLDEVILFDTITYRTDSYGNWTTRTHFTIKEVRYIKHEERPVLYKNHQNKQ